MAPPRTSDNPMPWPNAILGSHETLCQTTQQERREITIKQAASSTVRLNPLKIPNTAPEFLVLIRLKKPGDHGHHFGCEMRRSTMALLTWSATKTVAAIKRP